MCAKKEESNMKRISSAIIILIISAGLSFAGVDKSGVKPNVISLPSGPGSVEGLGESFEPQLNSGTTSYAVKLKVPPGRAGFAPDLALQYNGGSGNGIFGMGWSLSNFRYGLVIIHALHSASDRQRTPGV